MDGTRGNGLLRVTPMDKLLILGLFLANLPSFSFWYFSWKYFTIELMQPQLAMMIAINSLLWIVFIFLLFQYLRKNNALEVFSNAWKKQGLLVAFIVIAFFSIFWSISPLISSYKVLILVASSLLGSFIGLRTNLSRWLDSLFWFGLALTILTIAFALMLPGIGTMTSYPYVGEWRGIFWHKNHLGSIFALLNALYLIRWVSNIQNSRKQMLLDLVLYGITLVIVYLANSAAGFILTIVLNFSIGMCFLWLKVHSQLRKVHYFLLSGIFVTAIVLVATNLDFVFGLFNRSSSLTGRIPMWIFLFKNVIQPSPWIGYGFGSIWSISAFRSGIGQAVGWEFPVLIGDNGLIDNLLSVGLIGIIPFLGVFSLAWIRSIQHALKHLTLINFFPPLLMLFALLANVSYSLFLETESFIWLLMVAVLFIPTQKEKQQAINSQ